MTSRPSHQEGSVLDTLQSLIVAFVLAMTFRGFVTEGFVIPTGSMAPTLRGQHIAWHSDETGYEWAIDARQPIDDRKRSVSKRPYDVVDPMIGTEQIIASPSYNDTIERIRMGDRILVLKCLYPFSSPDRYDVVVFKNPTDPDGEAENYIKRLVGLPGEAIWLLDGDVFVWRDADRDDPKQFDEYLIQRKPAHVQRSVWRVVHESGYIPIDEQRVKELTGRPYVVPWSGPRWQTEGVRSYRCDTAEPTVLTWDDARSITDWTAYNMITRRPKLHVFRVSDVRVRAGIVADQVGLSTTLELDARGHRFEFTIAGGEARMRMRPLAGPDGWLDNAVTTRIDMPEPGRVYNVEFWHVDQSMSIHVDGEQVGDALRYDWRPMERVVHSYPGSGYNEWSSQEPTKIQPHQARLRWRFDGSPVTLHRVGVDRDLYYQPGRDRMGRYGFGTHPDHLAVLGDDHFMMLGDNSAASLDSRFWGAPHELVASQIDESSFVVERRLLLGKAWVVYFPAPYSMSPGGRGIIPDFGRLRFIR